MWSRSAITAVLVVDFGAQYAQLIARRVRELNVYSEIVPHRITAAEVAAKQPSAIILSGGPKSVHVEGAPSLDPAIYDLGIPILGICYGVQLIAQQLGGTVGRGLRGEYGRAKATRSAARRARCCRVLPAEQDVWMSHFDAVTEVPEGFVATATTPDAPVAAIEHPTARSGGCSGTRGRALAVRHARARAFLHDLAGLRAQRGRWARSSTSRWRRAGPGRARAGDLRLLSGGVDSAVAAALVHRAIGHQLACIYVDTGLMRLNESDQVVETFKRNMGIELIHVTAGPRYFEKLAGVTEPEPSARSSASCSCGSSKSTRAASVTPSTWCRARCTPTSSRAAAATARRRSSRATTTSVACPRT
jgi:GMP synthase (glutamine-hydrolysing)